MKYINISDIPDSCEVILDKAGRVVDGINHGRKVLRDKQNYYKVFDLEYCRRDNFIQAYNIGFFDGLAPALKSIIKDGDEIVGYVTEVGELISNSEFDFHTIPKEFYQRVLEVTIVKEMFFYDLVPINIIKTSDGKISLIDLESVYPIEELYQIGIHNATVKPFVYLQDLHKIWKDKMKPISFIQPSRNNLKYLKWSYESIRKNLSPIHEICWADDYSDDGTWEWMNEIAEKDPNVKIHRNEGPNRLGHTILYDTLVNDYATNDIVMIYHADMYACPGMDEAIMKHIRPGVVVSGTRIEPPLHPAGPEKILADCGIEPEEFDEELLLELIPKLKDEDKTTNGIFAPWAMYKKDFQSIGGHDPLYAPQSKEDSDIFNRFVLNEYQLVQTWEGFVYHMTSRGSRFKDGAMRNPKGEVFMKGRESDEWLAQNQRSTRNFIRKWGHFVKHDTLMKPIIPPKYDIGFVVENCTTDMLREIEPWCSDIYGDWVGHKGYGVNEYIKEEQPNTLYDLSKKIHSQHIEPTNDIVVEFDCNKINSSNFQILVELSSIIHESGEIGEMEYEIFKFKIKTLNSYEQELVICER